jgi:prolyl 4-hydroxylase
MDVQGNSKAYLWICVGVIAVAVAVIVIVNTRMETYDNNQNFTKNTELDPEIQEIDNFLSHEECDKLIISAEGRLKPSEVYAGNTNIVDKTRESMQAWMKDDDNEISNKIAKLTSEIAKLPMENSEDLQVVNYTKGGYFKPHYDACEGSEEFCKLMNKSAGPRYLTFLIYLNDDYKGGETHFPNLNKTVKPKKGKLVIFKSTDSNGVILEKSLHGGNPVTKGKKWICNKWYHFNKYE